VVMVMGTIVMIVMVVTMLGRDREDMVVVGWYS
jgi:hypothetical protein